MTMEPVNHDFTPHTVEYRLAGTVAKFPYPDWDQALEHYFAATVVLCDTGVDVCVVDVQTGEEHRL